MKKSLSIMVVLFLSMSVFAADWYICMGSFKNPEKAKARADFFNENGFSVFITELKKSEDESLYRILYSEKFKDKNDAKYRRDELLQFSKIKELGLSDIWYCEFEGKKFEDEKQVEVVKEIVKEVPREPEKQTVIVKINNIEEQRFDITTEDRLIRVNVEVPVNTEVVTENNLSVEENNTDSTQETKSISQVDEIIDVLAENDSLVADETDDVSEVLESTEPYVDDEDFETIDEYRGEK